SLRLKRPPSTFYQSRVCSSSGTSPHSRPTLALQPGFRGKDRTQFGQCLLASIPVTGKKRQGSCELRSVSFGVTPDDAPHLDRSEHHASTAGDLASYDEVRGLVAKGLDQIIHGFEAVDALLAFVRCRPFDEPTRVPARVGDKRQEAHGTIIGREDISPQAVGLLSSHFDGLTGLDVEEIHAGSRSGTLTRSRLGTLTGSIFGDAGVSSGTRPRGLSGSPISAIDYLAW